MKQEKDTATGRFPDPLRECLRKRNPGEKKRCEIGRRHKKDDDKQINKYDNKKTLIFHPGRQGYFRTGIGIFVAKLQNIIVYDRVKLQILLSFYLLNLQTTFHSLFLFE